MDKAPTDLKKALASNIKAKSQWQSLTPIARRDFSTWIESAKQEKTRERRVAKACDMLAKGKRRPCCYSPVPLSLYSALSADPKAKATWTSLTSDQRRDFADWVGSGKGIKEVEARTEKARSMLAAGKRRP